MTGSQAGEGVRILLDKTGSLRDDLLIAVTKLEAYANALQAEVVRLKRMAEERASDDGPARGDSE